MDNRNISSFQRARLIMLISRRYSQLGDRACQLTAGLTSIFLQTELKDHLVSLVVTQFISSSGLFCFLDRNYCYKSVATQIPCNTALSQTGIESKSHTILGFQCSVLSNELPQDPEKLFIQREKF